MTCCTPTRCACRTGRGSRCGVPTEPGGRSCSCTGCPPTPGCGTARPPARRRRARGGGGRPARARRAPSRSRAATRHRSARPTSLRCARSWAGRRPHAGGGRAVVGRQRRPAPRRRARRRGRRRLRRRWLHLAGRALPTFEACWAELAPPRMEGVTLAELTDRFRGWFADFPPRRCRGSAREPHRGPTASPARG